LKKQKKDPAKTITKTPKVKLGPIKKQNQKQVTETVHTYQRPQVKKQNYVRQTTRKIVDREQEIYSNSKIVDKDNILFSGNNYRFMININSLDKIINTIKSYGSMRYNGKLLFPVLVHKRSENILFEVSDKKNISNKDDWSKR